jgi:hypothetical protein
LGLGLDVFGEVGGDGLVEFVEHAHGEHRVDVSGLDQFVERIRELHPDAASPEPRCQHLDRSRSA